MPVMTEVDYNNQIDYIFNRFPSFQKLGSGAYKPGIDSVRTLMEHLGNPQRNFKSVHIAGTNGKGSSSHMIAASLASVGLKVGLYTSPHLIDFRERIKTSTPGGAFEMLPHEFVYDFITCNKTEFEKLNVSFFEITTAMAFCWFDQCKIDIAVIECGLGGRLDSTNIISPLLCIITNIGLDHCALLGNTTEKIAAEKSGIIKRGVPVVIGEASGVAGIFKERAQTEGSAIHFAEEMQFAGSGFNKNKGNFLCGITEEQFNDILRKMDLGGACQRKNLRTVLCSLSVLNLLLIRNFFPHQGDSSSICATSIEPERTKANLPQTLLGKELEAIINAAHTTGLHGRWEILEREPFIVCDTGHNPHGFALLGGQIAAEYGKWREKRPYARLLMIFGIMADKDLDSIVDYLPKEAEYIYVAPATQRAMQAKALEEKMCGLGFRSFNGSAALGCEGRIGNTLSLYKKIKRKDDFVFIGGSTFVVAEALEWLTNNHKKFCD